MSTDFERERAVMKDLVAKSRAARDEAIQRVDDHADTDWKEVALEAVYQTCLNRDEFISDDVWLFADIPNTRDNRAFGPVMRRAASKGWCRKSDKVRPATRGHMRPMPVWISLLRGPTL